MRSLRWAEEELEELEDNSEPLKFELMMKKWFDEICGIEEDFYLRDESGKILTYADACDLYTKGKRERNWKEDYNSQLSEEYGILFNKGKEMELKFAPFKVRCIKNLSDVVLEYEGVTYSGVKEGDVLTVTSVVDGKYPDSIIYYTFKEVYGHYDSRNFVVIDDVECNNDKENEYEIVVYITLDNGAKFEVFTSWERLYSFLADINKPNQFAHLVGRGDGLVVQIQDISSIAYEDMNLL